MARKLNILIIYVMNKYPMRATLWDQLYCFRHYSNHNCFYLNLSVRSVPWYLEKIKFDIIVFGTLFLANRIRPEWFEPVLEKARRLKSLDAIKIAFPQDEHTHTNVLMDFLEEFGVEVVFSVGPPSEWPKLYDRPAVQRIKFFNVLTGCLNDQTVDRINRLTAAREERSIDIGYRTWPAGAWLGRHGLSRQKIADVFQERGPAAGFITDISTRREDTFWGDDWYKFLLRCKYSISVEGGSSVPDQDGTLQEKIEAYQSFHPQAGFDEIEENCFPGLDGRIQYVALSPRHLECCVTRTCQVLIEGDYNDILRPGDHYIELKRDFSNIEQVLSDMRREDLRSGITERAYRDVVASGNYTYQSYVDSVLEKSLAGRSDALATPSEQFSAELVYYWMRVSEFLSWLQVALYLHSVLPRLKGLVRKTLVSVFSEETVVSVLNRGNANKD